LVSFKIDKEKLKKICDNFLKENYYNFILSYLEQIERTKITEINWNKEADSQNGIVELHKTGNISIKLDEQSFDLYMKNYLK